MIYGAAYDDSLGEDIRVTVVATGLSRPGARRQAMSVVQGGLRTGTDNKTLVGTPTASMNAALAGGNPVAAAPVGAAGVYGSGDASTSSVWGSNRTSRTHAAARVDALSSGGMDDLEIPAFLRKQAD